MTETVGMLMLLLLQMCCGHLVFVRDLMLMLVLLMVVVAMMVMVWMLLDMIVGHFAANQRGARDCTISVVHHLLMMMLLLLMLLLLGADIAAVLTTAIIALAYVRWIRSEAIIYKDLAEIILGRIWIVPRRQYWSMLSIIGNCGVAIGVLLVMMLRLHHRSHMHH